MTRKRKIRKLHLLLWQYQPHTLKAANEFKDQYNLDKDWNSYSLFMANEIRKIHAAFDELGFTTEDRMTYWQKYRAERSEAHSEYFKKPVYVRQDNKDHINFQRHNQSMAQCNTIRLPKKCRKTAWKRFNKLFPMLVKHKAWAGIKGVKIYSINKPKAK